MTGAALAGFLERTDLTPERVAELYAHARAWVEAEVEAVVAERAAGGAIPIVDYEVVAAGDVGEDAREAVRRRGCVVVRRTFDPDLALAWDAAIARYLDVNRFTELYAAKYAEADARRIWGVYWSPPQVAARQHPNMATVRRFLNSFWRHESDGRSWFEPDRDIGYPDRLRRRAPGRAARGLPPHSDAVSSGGWRIAENERVFADALAGGIDRYDPWDAAHRTTVDGGSSDEAPAPASVFRTFQGWTALSEMRPTDGVLHTIPIPAAAAYMLLRGLAGELGVLDGVAEEAPRRFRADELLLRASTPIPAVEPGDTVWWHGDVIHSVADATNDTRWGNVMYIAATPGCPRNDAYRRTMLERFERGASPADFPDEDFEETFTGRATVGDLNEIGRRHFGLV